MEQGEREPQHPFSPTLLAEELAGSYPDPCLYLISLLAITQYLALQFTMCSYRHPGICRMHSPLLQVCNESHPDHHPKGQAFPQHSLSSPLCSAFPPTHLSPSNVQYNLFICIIYIGFPGGSVVKESTCQCWRCKRRGFDPWVGKIPWRRKWQPTPISLPRTFNGQKGLEGYSPWSHKLLHMTECEHKHESISYMSSPHWAINTTRVEIAIDCFIHRYIHHA